MDYRAQSKNTILARIDEAIERADEIDRPQRVKADVDPVGWKAYMHELDRLPTVELFVGSARFRIHEEKRALTLVRRRVAALPLKAFKIEDF